MDNRKKTDFQCFICKKILNNPIDLPCNCGNCTICQKHLKDDSAKNGSIKCETCKKEYLARNIELKVNIRAKKALDAEQYLSKEEKQAKNEIYNRFFKL